MSPSIGTPRLAWEHSLWGALDRAGALPRSRTPRLATSLEAGGTLHLLGGAAHTRMTLLLGSHVEAWVMSRVTGLLGLLLHLL